MATSSLACSTRPVCKTTRRSSGGVKKRVRPRSGRRSPNFRRFYTPPPLPRSRQRASKLFDLHVGRQSSTTRLILGRRVEQHRLNSIEGYLHWELHISWRVGYEWLDRTFLSMFACKLLLYGAFIEVTWQKLAVSANDECRYSAKNCSWSNLDCSGVREGNGDRAETRN